MKKKIPQIKFFYSQIYDAILTEYEGKNFSKRQKEEVEKYIKKFQREWKKIEKPILKFLLKIFPKAKENEKIVCYFVKNFKISGISHPLTIRMSKDVQKDISTLIHELIHIFLVCEKQKWKKVFKTLMKKFPKEKRYTIVHLFVNFVHLKVLKKFFPKSTVQKLIREYKKFKRIGKAWQIVLKEEKNFQFLFKI